MKNIFYLIVILTGFIGMIIDLYQIFTSDRVLLFSILLIITIPGFSIALVKLVEKIHLEIKFRIDK